MDTNGLRLFVLAAEKLNISAAGRDLCLAPAVASARLAKLERTLGADLFHRSTRKVALSLEGAEFLPFAREILAQEDAAFAALGKGQARVSGTIRFAAPSTFAQLYIAPILPALLEANPDLALDLRLSDAQFDLIEGSFDLALRNVRLTDSSLKGRKLADDTRILCAAPAYLALHGAPETPEDLTKHKLIGFRDRQRRMLRGRGGEIADFDPGGANSQLVVDDGLSMKRATLAGAGISINSLWSVHAELHTGELVQVLPDFESAEEHVLWLVYPKTNVLSAKVRVFMDYLVERLGKSPPWCAER